MLLKKDRYVNSLIRRTRQCVLYIFRLLDTSVTWSQTGAHLNGVHMYAIYCLCYQLVKERFSWSPRPPGRDSSEIRLRLN